MLMRTRISLAVGAAFLAGAPAVMAQSQQLDRVEITGSSIKRIEGETALPVQIITREEIQRTGVSNVEQLMQRISSNSSSGTIVSSGAAGATTLGISSISLRGLNSTRTLVLINGRRVAPYGYGFTNDNVSVDVNSIPVSAIDRIEILRDGASAVYGSDAIAGVVNFILRREYRGVEVSAEYGTSTEGGGDISRADILFGHGDLAKDRFNFMAMLSASKEKPLFGRDRSFASSGINENALNDTSSGNTFPANIAAADGSFGSRNPSVATANPCPGPYSTLSPFFPADRCRFDPSPLVSLIPDSERVALFLGGKFQVTPTMEAYAEAAYAKNKQNTVIQPSPISDQFTIPLNNPLANQFPYNAFVGGVQLPTGTTSPIPYSTILLRSTSPFYPTAYVQSITGGATPDLLVRWRAADLGNRDFTDESKQQRLVLGLRGTTGPWEYDGAFLYTSSKVTESVNDGYAILTRIMPLLNSGNVNFFGPNSATVLDQLAQTEFHGTALETKSSLTSVSGKASRDLLKLKHGSMVGAFGAEFRQEDYKLNPSSYLIEGDLTGYGGNFAPVDKSRDVAALFAEFNIPILPRLEANAAVRYDDYQGVGSSTTPKIALRWTPSKQWLVRAAVGKGFRAPSLLDLHAPATTGVTPPGLNDPLRCVGANAGNPLDCATQFPITNGGKADLNPEKSTSKTVGIVFEPVNNFSIGIDYFNIRLTDTISNGIPAATILSDLTRYGSLVTRGAPLPSTPGLPGPIIDIDQTNINQGETKLSGYDVDARWSGPATRVGRFGASLTGTYFTRYDAQNPDGSFSNQLDTANNNTGGVIVRWRYYATVTWTSGPYAVTLAQTYQKKYDDLPATFEDPIDPAFKPRKVGSYQTFDLQGSYQATKSALFTLGVKNIFDQDPPYTNAGGQTSFQAGYEPTYVDPRGRFIYGRINYKFR